MKCRKCGTEMEPKFSKIKGYSKNQVKCPECGLETTLRRARDLRKIAEENYRRERR